MMSYVSISRLPIRSLKHPGMVLVRTRSTHAASSILTHRTPLLKRQTLPYLPRLSNLLSLSSFSAISRTQTQCHKEFDTKKLEFTTSTKSDKSLSTMEHLKTTQIEACGSLENDKCDSVVLVTEDISILSDTFSLFKKCLEDHKKIIPEFNSGVHVIYCDQLPSKRLIVSFTGPLDRDYDDIRRINEAAKDGIARAIKIGSTAPLLALTPLKTTEKLRESWVDAKSLCLTALLGAFHALYVPLEVREFSVSSSKPGSVKSTKADSLFWFTESFEIDHKQLVHAAWCLEEGRRVARDIGGSDPERMCASRIADYIQAELAGSVVKVKTELVNGKEYPLAAAVDRGSNEKHRGRIMHLEYIGEIAQGGDAGSVKNLFLIGKGIVYDTGGLDLKVGGSMATMLRDKCGAAAVAGFFKTASLLKPKNLNLHGSLAVIRNSISDCAYASDEVITSRAGVRVRVNNTDAEGRMVMTDLLCEAKEKAVSLPNPHLMTFATLTGHVILAYGPSYTGIMCNGAASQMKADQFFQEAGSLVGELSELSTIRREDFQAHKTSDEYADLQNSASASAGKRYRGHQSAAAFMICASGLESHMAHSDKPLPYTHFDIAGSQGPCPGVPTAAPLLTLASQYLLSDYWAELLQMRL